MAMAYEMDTYLRLSDDKAEMAASAFTPNESRHIFANLPKVLPIFLAFIRTE